MTVDADPDEELSVPAGTPEPLQSAGALHDPFEWYTRKRRAGPIHRDDRRGVFDVFSYEHVAALLGDDRLIRQDLSRGHGAGGSGSFSYLGNAMVWSDGDKHRQAKHQLFEYFRPDQLAGLEPAIREAAESQLRVALEGGPTFDFVEKFAVPVPLRVIMHVVGIPQEDRERVLDWLETFRTVMYTEYSAAGAENPELMAEAVAYFEQLVARRRREPQEDLLSRLATETDLSPAEIGANCFDFVLAGQGTMSEFLSNALFLFDEVGWDPAADLSVVLEEVLRYRAPLQCRARETTRRVTVDGTEIPAGETVILWIGAANRDPSRYERSDRFLPDRDPDHLAFGRGPHTCIGAPLARLQAPIVLRTFLDRFERIELHDDAVPKPKPSKLGFERLPVSTTPV